MKPKRRNKNNFGRKWRFVFNVLRNTEDLLAEEEKISKINGLKIQEKWRHILRQAKTKELKSEIETLSENHEHVTEYKDNVISRLEKMLEEEEEQHLVAIRAHLENIKVLLQSHHTRVEELQKEFELEVKELQEDFEKEK